MAKMKVGPDTDQKKKKKRSISIQPISAAVMPMKEVVPVFVDKPMFIEKTVEVFVDRPVEIIKEVFIDRPVEKIVEVPTEKIVERVVFKDKPGLTVFKTVEKEIPMIPNYIFGVIAFETLVIILLLLT
jgi:hypothetical protein